nr:helix-turn-helix transcriptional regulator [Burkholderiaceae bacterium]
NWHGAALALMAPLLHALAQQLMPVRDDAPFGAMAQLTRRQREIVRAVARGHDDKSIARTMGISDKTVRNQLSVVYGLLGLSRRTQLAALLL